MFSNMYPLKPEQMIQESFAGLLGTLKSMPIRLSLGAAEMLLASAYLHYFKPEKFIKDQIEKFEKAKDSPSNRFDIFKICILAPVLEELFFRGLLTPVLRAGLQSVNLDPAYASLISSLVFGSVHELGSKSTAAYFGSMSENLVNAHQGSLWASTASHIFNNTVLLFSSGLYSAQAQKEKIETGLKTYQSMLSQIESKKQQQQDSVASKPSSTMRR